MAKATFSKMNKPSATISSTKNSKQEDMSSLISKKAYELYEKRGRKPGHAMEDWLEAEKLVKKQFSK